MGGGREDSRMRVFTDAFPADAEQCAMLSASLGSQEVALSLFASELASSSSRTSSHGNKMSAPEQKVLDFLQRDSLSQAPHRGHCSWCDTQGHMPDPADWEGWPQPHGSGGEMWLPERNGGAATRIRVTDARRQVYSCSDLWVSY